MEALCAEKFGAHKDVLRFQNLVDTPKCSTPTDVVIKVAYSELNPVDLQKLRGSRQQAGQPVPNAPFIPGYGGSGIVEQVGEAAPAFLKGKRVAFMADPSRPGSYATHMAVDHRLVAEIPGNVSFRDAATVPLSGCTAYESLVKLGLGKDKGGGISEEDTLLVIGAAGGVGSWAMTLAKAWHPKLRIVATASSLNSQQWCNSLGAHEVVPHSGLLNVTTEPRKGNVSHILCLTEPTPSVFGEMEELIKPYGTICLVVAGSSIKSLDLGFCFFKAADIVLETVFSSIRTKFNPIVPSKEIADILEVLSSGSKSPLSPQLENISEDWKDAMQEKGLLDSLASGHTRGKLVMKIGSDDM